jgi:hypothetical protein
VTTEQLLLQRIDNLHATVMTLAQCMGTRLTREQMCQRRGGIHRNTLAGLIERGIVPRPDASGRWLLAEVIRWEEAEQAGRVA